MALTQQEIDGLIAELKDWKRKRLAAMFEIPCSSHEQALSLRDWIKQFGFNGFVTRMGTWVGIVFYLTDHKNKSDVK